jgi:mRNA interferase RelE/StbE
MYELRILDAALNDLKRLDKPIARRILSRLDWLTVNFDALKPESLSGELRDFYKFRVGDYRVIYQFIAEEEIILVHAVGHRRDIYK